MRALAVYNLGNIRQVTATLSINHLAKHFLSRSEWRKLEISPHVRLKG